MKNRLSLPCLLGAALFLCTTTTGCGDDDDFRECAPPSASSMAKLPPLLSDAGLFSDMEDETLHDRVWLFEPRFPLWTDGAKKRRWLSIPKGTSIDTSDMDDWRFPVGTKLFKEFVRDGVRVETRILLKTGAGDADWAGSAYVWTADQKDAKLHPDGGSNMLGTPHDVPGAGQCMGCHGGRASTILGFSAIQLAWEPTTPGAQSAADFKAKGVLPANVPETIALPGTAEDHDALGYLHANCGHCHNNSRPASNGPRCYDPQENFDLSLPANPPANVRDLPAHKTSVAENVMRPGNASNSEIVQRMSRGNPRMPALGTEVIDTTGRALITDWVNSL